MPECCRCTWYVVCFHNYPPIGQQLLQSISVSLCSDEKQGASVPGNLLLWFPIVTAQNRYSSTERDPLKQAARGVCPRSGGHLCQGVLTLWPKGCCSTTMLSLPALGRCVPVWKAIHQAMPRAKWARGQPAMWLEAGLACSAHSSGGKFAYEGHRCSPYSFGASLGSETQVSLRAPVWKGRTLLDCSDNEKQDPESHITCLAQQEPGLMELLSCLRDKFCSSFQHWNPGHVVWTWFGRHSMSKTDFFFFFLAGSVQLDLTHQAGTQALVLALWRWQHSEKEQTARGHGTTKNVHQPMFLCLAIVHFSGKHFPIHSHLHTAL